jgi:hypothetical protein
MAAVGIFISASHLYVKMVVMAAQGACQITERWVIEVDLRHAGKMTKEFD